MALRRVTHATVSRSVTRAPRRALVVTMSQAGAGGTPVSLREGPRNVLGGILHCCCTSPRTGYFRDGFCRTDETDMGRHVVCAQMTIEFLEYTRSMGNDLSTPAPWFNFPGLKPGDKWCLCALRWKEALQAGKAPPVFLRCTHQKALEYVRLEDLQRHAADLAEVNAENN